jgi:hypothetical protein
VAAAAARRSWAWRRAAVKLERGVKGLSFFFQMKETQMREELRD